MEKTYCYNDIEKGYVYGLSLEEATELVISNCTYDLTDSFEQFLEKKYSPIDIYNYAIESKFGPIDIQQHFMEEWIEYLKKIIDEETDWYGDYAGVVFIDKDDEEEEENEE